MWERSAHDGLLADESVDSLLELVLRLSAYLPLHHLTVLDEEDRGDADHAVAGGDLGIGVYVHLADEDPKVLQASTYAYIIPLVLIILEAVLLPKYLGIGEMALIGVILATVSLYAVLLWVLRDHFKRIFTFRIRPLRGTHD